MKKLPLLMIISLAITAGCAPSKPATTSTATFYGYPCDCPADLVLSLPTYADTAAANRDGISSIDGVMILTGDSTMWVRSAGSAKWTVLKPKKK